MKYTSQKLLAATFFLSLFAFGSLWAGPEKYDHLGEYKLPKVSLKGPSQEVVTNARGEQIARALYYYNKNNQIAKVEYFKGAASDGRSLYVYDQYGLAEERLVNAQNVLIERIVYERDREQNVVSYSVYDQDNKKLLTWKFKYDKGRLVAGVRFSENDITERFERVYKNSSIITTLYTQNNEIAGTIVSTVKNNRVVARSKNDLTGSYRIEYSYDPKGRIDQMNFYANRGQGEIKLKTHQFSYAPGGDVMTREDDTRRQSAMRHASLLELDRAHPAQR